MFTSWSSSFQPPVTSGQYQMPLVPRILAHHPHTWSKEDVKIWLRWCADEYSLEPISLDTFDMNGKALDLLTKKDFIDRVPKSGDVLFNAFQLQKKKHSVTHADFTRDCSPCRVVGPEPQCYYKSSPCRTSPVLLSPRTNSIFLASDHNTSVKNSPEVKSEKTILPLISLPATFSSSDCKCPSVSNLPVSVSRSNGVFLLSSQNNLSPKRSCSSTKSDYSFITDLSSCFQTATFSSDVKCVPKVSTSLPESILTPASISPKSESTVSDADSTQTDDMTMEENIKHQEEVTDDKPSPLITLDCIKRDDNECRLLWEFIHQLLMDPSHAELVIWENQNDLTFRILNPTGLAKLWGMQKNRTNMTYEKLSRALRYYYKMNIIKKVPGKRLTYRFLQHPRNIKKGQRGAKPHVNREVAILPQLGNSVNESETNEMCFGDSRTVPNEGTPFSDSGSPLQSSTEWEQSREENTGNRSQDSYDQSCDVQFIDGRLVTIHSSPNRPSDYLHSVKPEFPEQNEPEDLSMKKMAKPSKLETNVFGTNKTNEIFETNFPYSYSRELQRIPKKTEGCS